MAQAPVFTVNAFPYGVDNTQHQEIVYGLLTFTGSGGYTTGGLPVTWKFLNQDGSTFYPQTSSTTPFLVYFQPQDTGLVSYQYNKAGGTLFATTAGAQVASGTTLSGVVAFEAHFARSL